MRHTLAVRRVAVILVAVVAGAVASAPTTAVGTRPTLRLIDDSSLVFSGSGFRSSEHVSVRVVVISGRRGTKRVTAGPGGRFAVRFRGMNASEACRGLTATAIGDRGSRATYKRAPGVCPVD